MPLLAKDERPPRELPPTGLCRFVFARVEDMNYEDFQGDGNFKHKVWVGIELEHLMADDRQFMLSNTYTLTMNEKGNLRRDMEGWLGRPMTDVEIDEGYDVEALIGQCGMVNVIHKEGQKGAFAAIGSFAPSMAGQEDLKITVTETPEWVLKRKAENRVDPGVPF